MAEENNDIERQYDLVLESVSKKLEQQISSLSSFDTKSNILLALVGVLFAGYVQLLTSEWKDFKSLPLFVILQVLSFMMAGFFIFRSFILDTTEVWRNDPRPSLLLEVFSENSEKGEYWLKSQIIKNISESYEHNDALIKQKYNSLIIARWALCLGAVTFILHILIVLYGWEALASNVLQSYNFLKLHLFELLNCIYESIPKN